MLRRWERSKQKFGFIKRVDKDCITTVKDLEMLTTPVEKRKNENNLYSLNTLWDTPTENKNISSVFILFTFMQI